MLDELAAEQFAASAGESTQAEAKCGIVLAILQADMPSEWKLERIQGIVCS